MCPSLAQVLTNTYQAPVRCVVQGGGEILSTEGTTQGDPLAMAMYALAMRPLIDRQQMHCPTIKQEWYADDATGAGTCSELRTWWDSLLKQGQPFNSPKLPTHTAFVRGLSSRWTYLSRTIPGVSNLFQPLENAIHQVFIPAITGFPPCSKITRDLLALPVRLGGLGLNNPAATSNDKYQASVKLTAPLVSIIVSQDQSNEVDPSIIIAAKKEIKTSNHQYSEEQANAIYDQLSPQQKRC